MPQLTGVARLRLSPGEVESLLRDEKERRRKLRIKQVREKSKQIAKSKLEAVRQEKVRQLELLAEKIEEEWQADKQSRIEQLEKEYAESLKCIGTAHTQADELDLGLEQKAIAMQENSRRAEERYTAAIRKLNEDRLLQAAEDAKVSQARDLTVAKEKIRAKEIASLPPPVKSGLKNLLKKAKAAYVQLTDANTYTYPYQIPADQCLVERNDNSINDGVVGAEEERIRVEDFHQQTLCTATERLEKARVRGTHALKRERMRQDYNNMMNELDLLEKADRKHRQQNLEHIPQSLFLPAHVVMEREVDRQTKMERKVEEIFVDDYDPADLRACAPALNYDTTPTVTERTSSSPLDSDPRPPVSRVRDGEPGRSRAPLQDVTNLTPTSSETNESDTGSEKKRRGVLKKILKKISHQKEQWVSNEELVIPTHQIPQQQDGEDGEVPAEDFKTDDSTSNGTLSQVPDITSSEHTEDQISQTKISSSEGETTTSSEFIERQRQELLEYMKSLESQIGQLENLKKDKQSIEQDEVLAKQLEKKLTTMRRDEGTDTDSYVPHVSEGEEPSQSHDHLERNNRLTRGAGGASGIHTHLQHSDTVDSSLQSDVMIRRPEESTWEWYLRLKGSLGESIKQKLHQITSTERGYELDSPLPSGRRDNLQKSPMSSHLQTATSYTDDLHHSVDLESRGNLQFTTSGDLQRGYDLHQHAREPRSSYDTRGYLVTPEYEDTPRAELHTRPHPPGYVSVTEREFLARGGTPRQQTASADIPGDSLRGEPFPTASYGHPEVPPLALAEPEFISVPERERLMRAPLDRSVEDRTLAKESLRPDQLQQDLAEQTKTLERLQEMMSSARDEHIIHSSAPPITAVQSQAGLLLPTSSISDSKPLYMSIDERENLLHTLSHRLLSRDERTEPPRPTWGDVFTSRPSLDSVDGAYIPRSTDSTHVPRSTDNACIPRSTVGDLGFVPPVEAGGLRTAAGAGALMPSTLSQTSTSIPGVTSHISQSETVGWSPVHQQMLARQQEFNRRQEELRKQLADIQEQKRKLLSSSNERDLYDTQESLKRTLEGLGIDLDCDEAASRSTPGERRTRPPVTAKAGLDDLDFHELSIIQEVDTPTHLTTCDESTLLQSLTNINSNARPSGSSYRSMLESGSATPSIVISDHSDRPIRSQESEAHAVGSTRYGAEPINSKYENVNQNAQVSPSGAAPASIQSPAATVYSPMQAPAGHMPSPMEAPAIISGAHAVTPPVDAYSAAGAAQVPSPDSGRLQVLNQLLEQLEERRAQRQRFLEKEKLTTLQDEAMLYRDQPFTDVLNKYKAQSSPTLLDLYSSDSADDLVIPPPLSSTDSRESTPSGETLTKRLHEINKEWMAKPITVPKHVAEGLTSSESTSTHSSEKLRQLYAEQVNVGAGSESTSTSLVDSSPRLYNLEELLQGISSVSNSSDDSRYGNDKTAGIDSSPVFRLPEIVDLDSSSDSNIKLDFGGSKYSGRAASKDGSYMELSGGRELSGGGREVSGGGREASGGGREVTVGSEDLVSLSQSSEHSSSISKTGGELTQAIDNSVAPSIVQSEESSLTMKTAQHSTNSSLASAESPAKTVHMDLQLTIAEVSGSIDETNVSTPIKPASSGRPSSSTPLKHGEYSHGAEQISGPMEEQEITFASTVGDQSMTMVEDPEQAAITLEGGTHGEPSSPLAAQGLQWVEEEPAGGEFSGGINPALTDTQPDVRPKTTVRKDVDSAARKRQQKEKMERTKRMYNQLEEVKERKAYKAREQQKVDVQARRKEYGNQLQNRARK